MKIRTNVDFMISGRRINLKHLRAFRAVALHSHFTRAADAIGLSQPALSTLITQLEEDLSVKLLNRTTRAVELTPAGREFLESCIRILADFEGAVGAAKDYADLRTGRLRIAVLPSLSRTLLPDLLKAYRQEYPGVIVSVSDLVGDRLVEEVVSGSADIGIGYSESSALIKAEALLSDSLVAVCRTDALGPDVTRMQWRELAGHDVIAMNMGTTVRRLMDDGARQADVELHVTLESHQMPTALAYVRAGLGIAVLPSSVTLSDAEKDLSFLPLVEPVVTRQLSILTRTGQPASPAVQAFTDQLRQAIADIA